MTERARASWRLRHPGPALMAGLLAGALALAPHPTYGAPNHAAAAARAAASKPATAGSGRIAGTPKKDGLVSGTGRRAAGSRIGGK
jgi:hypothetical protein